MTFFQRLYLQNNNFSAIDYNTYKQTDKKALILKKG